VSVSELHFEDAHVDADPSNPLDGDGGKGESVVAAAADPLPVAHATVIANGSNGWHSVEPTAVVDATKAPVSAKQKQLGGVRRLSNPSHGPSLRPLITVSLEHISLEVVKRRALTWSSVTGACSSDDGAAATKLRILNNINAVVEPGKLVVMMGSSGAGKSTLLDLLSHRSTLLDNVKGSVLFNGAPLEKHVWESVVGCVQQADHLLPFLSVAETLRFAACLRLPPSTTPSEREARVTAVISELGLQLCRHTLVGSADVKGISGGEMRRLSIGVQMLTDPSVLLLDEPSQSFDIHLSAHICQPIPPCRGFF
jgi:ABC-type nitrate/sulfonate/bicarbonate transport system ATPase subunit